MKTLVRNDTNVSLYIFPDSKSVTIEDNRISVGDPLDFHIGDCNSFNATLFTDVTPPEDWIGCKYLYTQADGWKVDPAYREPGSN